MCMCILIWREGTLKLNWKLGKYFYYWNVGLMIDRLSTQTEPGQRRSLGLQLGSCTWVLQCLALFWHPPGHHSLGRIGPEVLKSWNEKTEEGLSVSWATAENHTSFKKWWKWKWWELKNQDYSWFTSSTCWKNEV